MDEASKIKERIEVERSRLGQNFDEIENRWKDATDLKSQFDKHTGLALGAAMAGGLLISLIFSRDSNASRPHTASPAAPRRPTAVSKHVERVSDTLDDIVAGLVAVASTKLGAIVADLVPGFSDQYQEINRQRRREESSHSGYREAQQPTTAAD